jgi:trk system potassium uptake protein TrkH
MNNSPAKTTVLFFLALIAAGFALLSLPVSRADGEEFCALTNLFTAVSASCITGLSVVNIGTYFSFFGQLVILALMQLGGLGYMLVATAAALLLGRIALKDRRAMQELFDISSFADLKKITFKAVVFVFAIEAAGAVVLTAVFLKDFSFFKAAYFGIFHSVAAFCNAGFSLFTDGMALYASSPIVLYTMSLLIMLGAVGFFVIVDLYDACKNSRPHLLTHTKVVLAMTAGVTIAGFLFFLFFSDGQLVKGNGFFFSVNNAFFQSAAARTAGFSSVPVYLFDEFTEIIMAALMFIGAAPGGTGGGLKVTTLALVFIFVRGVLKGESEFTIFKSRVPFDLIEKALAVFILFIFACAFFSAALVLLEPDKRPMDVIFEAVSAVSTSGLSIGVSSSLSAAGKITVILAMILGRVGIISVLILMLSRKSQKNGVQYPQARIMVG